MNPPNHSETPRAFTLMELLAAVAILGILAAMLMPVIGATQRTSTQAACASNMRQIILALHQYAGDHGQLLPAAKSSQFLAWTRDTELLQYLPRRSAVNEFGIEGLWENAVFVCPESVANTGRRRRELRVTYAATAAIFGNEGTDKTVARHVLSINHPSRTPFLFETKPGDYVNGGYFKTWAEVSPDIATQDPARMTTLDFLHRGAMNVGMLDGSVRMLDPQAFRDFTEHQWKGL
ncbi:MAG TPA: prepilin-type N-terminal cleavage/methylation domain-containing protein [Terrimicrobiaceae bacterium]|nr:prepilin-type N-terminal cleavage/methylation domain-containing protein [Terrimicrobiaceae bacterium]